MNLTNFTIYTDREGKMPVLRRWCEPAKLPESHKYFVQYMNDGPVRCRPYPGQKTVWNYRLSTYVSLDDAAYHGIAIVEESLCK